MMVSSRLRIGFILARQFTLCAFANFVDILRLSADEGDRSRPIHCRWNVLSATMLPITSSCGVSVTPDRSIGNPTDYDYIVVVGGLIDEVESLSNGDVQFLKQAALLNIPLCGVCTGAFLLHKAGLMEGYRCCVNWFHHNDFLEQFEGLRPVSEQTFIVDRDRLTCSGGVGSAHLAAHLVDRHLGAATARKSLHIMVIDHQLEDDHLQPGIPLEFSTDNLIVKRAILIMQETLSEPITISKLCCRLGVGRRTFERYFLEEIKLTPNVVYKRIRLDKASILLTSTDISIVDIAIGTGFCDASHFIRSFKNVFGTTPALFRVAQHKNDANTLTV